MGARTFEVVASGETVNAAFANARREAQYECGHCGYTGTIAEKHSFVMSAHGRHSLTDARLLVRKLLEDDNSGIADKWGPAGCIEIEAGKYYFFGWASC